MPAHGWHIDVSGTWIADQIRIQSSDCPASLTDVVRSEIRTGNLNCTFTIEQRDLVAQVIQACPDATREFKARVDPSGRVYRTEQNDVVAEGCHWLFTNTFAAELADSPATVRATYRYDFDPACGVRDCRLLLVGRLRRVQSAERDLPSARRAQCAAATPPR